MAENEGIGHRPEPSGPVPGVVPPQSSLQHTRLYQETAHAIHTLTQELLALQQAAPAEAVLLQSGQLTSTEIIERITLDRFLRALP